MHLLPVMPSTGALGMTLVALLVAGRALPAWASGARYAAWAAFMMFALTVWRVESRLADQLAPDNEDKVSRVVLRIAGLPRQSPDSRQFEAEVLSSRPQGVPSQIMVSWNAPGYAGVYGRRDATPAEFPELVPGQVWQMALTLRTPSGARNPSAFDYEAYVFAQGVRAKGSVRGSPQLVRDDGWVGVSGSAQRARHYVREAMQPYLEGKRYGAVLLALTIGDQASVGPQDWLVFNRAGLTHLVSISGSHITMIAAAGGLAMLALWRRLRLRGRAVAEQVPAQVAAALAALLVAWLYCLLAGWGVPARRTFLMLAVVAVAQILRLPLSLSRLLAAVAVIVVVLDPWALFASGFWLSFGAVYILMASARWWGQRVSGEQPGRRVTVMRAIWVAVWMQLAITAGLMPLLALIFNDVSVVSPLVNAYAIPVISLIVTPLSLLCAAAAVVPGLGWLAALLAWVGHGAMDLIMVPTVWLAQWPWSSFTVAAAPLGLTVWAIFGLLLAIGPYGLPLRGLGWLFMVPALAWTPPRPGHGQWTLTALDVGQGSALVVQTASRVLVFDTGVRHGPDSDEGTRTVVPYLRSMGLRKIDVLVLSHADMDHAGGLSSVLKALPVGQSYASFDLEAHISKSRRLLNDDEPLQLPLARTSCFYGAHWAVDGVSFEFLWPVPVAGVLPGSVTPKLSSRQRNKEACVLRVSGEHHSMLLTGDIGVAEERQLVRRGLGAVDVVVAPHHGSRFSSSAVFSDATRPAHVISQNGWLNRYGHPAPAVQQRWQDHGAQFWRTDWHGAVTLASMPDGLQVQAERQTRPRYWQRQDSGGNAGVVPWVRQK